MPTNYPGSLDSMPNPTSSTYLDDSGFELDVVVSNLGDAIQALQSKVGVGASNQSAVASRILGADGTGASSWRQIATADLASNAITASGIAEGTTSGPTTTSSSFADMTDMSLTIVTTGGILIALLSARLSHSTSGTLSGICLSIDGSNVAKSERTFHCQTNNGQFALSTMHLWNGLSAASHTVKGRWYTSGGTLTGQSDNRSLILVELKR